MSEWLQERFRIGRKILGIPQTWSIAVRLTDKPGGNPNNAGWCNADATYENASIEIFDEIGEDETAITYILHELAHIATAHLDEVIEKMLDVMSEDDRAVFRPLYESAMETFVQRLARGIAHNKEELCSLHSSAEDAEESQPLTEESEEAPEGQSIASIAEALRSFGPFSL